jgi:nicotinate-nucleotide adenylyltransferase
MRIGLLGGTFDPIHLGHLILAERVREEARLDGVWFLPSFQPPHKADVVITQYDHRAAMAALAIAGQPLFRVETIERDLPPPSYTAHTLAALQQQYPKAEFHLIVGADCLPDLPKWFQPQRILAQASLLAVPRPGVELWNAEKLADELGIPAADVRLKIIDCPLVEIASRDIRARVAAGKSIRYLVPSAVEDYIQKQNLYRPSPA